MINNGEFIDCYNKRFPESQPITSEDLKLIKEARDDMTSCYQSYVRFIPQPSSRDAIAKNLITIQETIN